jgi:patatin-related protein
MPVPGERNARFLPEQEMRFAIVMYGGVSLAIYINGVAQELFRLVKATAPADPFPRGARQRPEERRVYFADPGGDDARPALEHSEPVYRELGQWLGIHGPEPPERVEGEPPPIRTRFVVDIISGTSAGGINGIFLGKAIANQQDLHPSARLWLETADIAQLLRDKDSWNGIPEAGRREPESLLNGHRLFWEARDALTKMAEGRTEIEGDPFRPAYAEQLELAVTATDVAGQQQPVRLGKGRFVTEPVHRKVFRFLYGIEETLGEEHSDFAAEDDVMLAFAARATSSFPFAFEPVKLDDVGFMAPELADFDPASWFAGYPDPGSVFFADGGYLDNKPFSYATQALRRRRADVPVSRKLLFVEPDPAPAVPVRPQVRERPDVYRNVADAMAGLPRFEPIRQDIADVTDRNAAVARLRDIELDAVKEVERDLSATGAHGGTSHEAYLSLRARTVLDRLAELAARLRSWSLDDPEATEAREKLAEWGGRQRDRPEQLERLDTAFEHRRQAFLHDRVNDMLRGGERLRRMARAVDEAGELPDGDGDRLRAFKLALNDAFDGLRIAERAPEARSPGGALPAEQAALFARVREAAPVVASQPESYVDAVAEFLRAPLAQARDGTAAALATLAGDSWTGRLLSAYYERFDTFDAIVLPLAYPTLGEANAVELWRVSPRDAPGMTPAHVEDPVDKLAGLRLHHFGAFLDEDYRENDLLWGRLDGAEAILHAVLPDPEHDEIREHFRIRAQAAILREAMPQRLRDALEAELRLEQGEAGDARLVQAFLEAYTPPPDLDDARRQALAGKALSIGAAVLAEKADKHRIPKLPLTLMARGGPSLVRVARLGRRIGRLNPF